ncbi:MAG: bifunctional diaminohydroxyphosphoribosylaminopyrimidine deaminase/5-amino-6-(5-phosphoribosylamino)uracil reductase RibD [Paludibacter sp.]|jgi:diaminohydroxyphosphoribosylaminopyrimidine deaminase/5-amino-6-(5-phosphoribosylamino)uracil reductase|nr:bifunctional diaminohydroxyphosphoribosylaminopyrimidine deaminase/5-amino-6-(5-phosphoribosylamino)uracil reductase RibD [Paludibacter sp.]
MKMIYDEKYMYRCLQLARIGNGFTAPNPMVGSVIVHNDKIIGEGYHQRYGEAHAEPNAINSVTDTQLLRESTLYVNLEPCSHFGKTPPCANLIITSGIPRVVIGTLDPNPKVSGRGIQLMREAGIEVEVGVLEKECVELNKRFFIWQRENRPFVLLKWAQTRDGFIDANRKEPGDGPVLISNLLTKQFTHKYRAQNQAIMVSTNTAVLDNPNLSVRRWSGKNPVRITIDRTGRIPENYHLLDQSVRTLVFTEQTNKLTSEKLEYITLPFDDGLIRNILQILSEKNIHSVLVEGGSQLLKSFISSGLWDEAHVEISPVELGDGVAAPATGVLVERSCTVEGHQWIDYVNRSKKF